MTSRFVAQDTREVRSVWRRLWRRLRPTDPRFAELFCLQAELAVEGLRQLEGLLVHVGDPDGRVREIEAIEKRADGVVDQMRALVRQALFPPFARSTVLELTNQLDDVLDIVEDAAECVHLYHVTAVTGDALKLAALATQSMLKLQQALADLRRIERPRQILALCAEVDDLEAQADHVMRAAMSKLFREEVDGVQVVKLKAVYEVLESLTDKCKHIANDIEAIVLRHG